MERYEGELYEMDVGALVPFKEHTFKVSDDAEMEELIQSIRDNGILEPGMAFFNDQVEVDQITGHRRIFAAKKLGLKTVPVLIKPMTREKATILMGESNLKSRSEILPSEKAATYKVMLEAMKRQGRRTDLYDEDRIRSDEELSRIVKESRSQIYRYLALNNLDPELLKLVDKKVMALRPAVEISYLPGSGEDDFQKTILDFYKSEGITPSLSQAKRIRDMFMENTLTAEELLEILSEKKPNQKRPSYKLSDSMMEKYFKDVKTDLEIERLISEALEYYLKEKGGI